MGFFQKTLKAFSFLNEIYVETNQTETTSVISEGIFTNIKGIAVGIAIIAMFFIVFFILKNVKLAKNIKAQKEKVESERMLVEPAVNNNEIKKSINYCDYCSGVLDESDKKCPNCGAINRKK